MAAKQLLVGLIVFSYFLGSIPFGLVVGLAKGVDVRSAGSGNIGATNVGRLLGKKFFFLVFFLDMSKGLLPMLAGAIIVRRSTSGSGADMLLLLGIGLAAILGHMFSVFLRFKGGKGVATSAGVILGLWPYFTLPGAVTILIFVIVVYLTRYISVGSIAAAGCFPVLYLGMGLSWGWDPLGRQLPLLGFAVIVAAMITYKHRTNISRLRAGTENRISGAKRAESSG
jgi:glycerol-3-phosphate acyltransferase PlsY